MKTILSVILIINISLYAQNITVYSGTQKELDSRWEWAIRTVNESDVDNYWIVYTIEKLMPENSTIGHYYNGDNKGKVLAEILYPTRPVDYINSLKEPWQYRSSKKVQKEIALFFEISDNSVVGTYLSTIDLSFNLKNLPVFWLGLTSQQQSLFKIMDIFYTVKSEDAKETLITAAGMHQSRIESYNFLKNIINKDSNSELRGEAVFWIGYFENADVVSFLKNTALNAHDIDVGEKAVFSLHNINSDEATDAIIFIARQAKSDVREKAIFWLGEQAGKRAIECLEEIAFSEDETEVQKQAVFTLSQLDDNKGIPILIKIAKTHSNKKIRKNAIFWLGESEDERALEALIEMVKK